VTLKMPAFEWVHVQLHQQKGMISLSPPTICNSAAKNGSIVEYQSVRTKPEPEQVLAAEKLYAQLRSGKAARPKLAASFSVKILLLIWGSIISSAMAAGMLTDTSISSLLLPGINAFTRCRSLTSIALSGSRIVTANQTDS
ncbi:hypothetical protein ACLXAZ_28670, partial [Escherichia coli]